METSDLDPETVTPESVRVERARLEALKAIAEETNRPELLQFDLKFRDQGEEVFLQKLSMDPDAAPLQAWFFKLNIALKNRSPANDRQMVDSDEPDISASQAPIMLDRR